MNQSQYNQLHDRLKTTRQSIEDQLISAEADLIEAKEKVISAATQAGIKLELP